MGSTNMSAVEKQYGLVEPKTGKKLSVSDVFNNDSDSGGEQDSKSKKFTQRDEKGVKRQTKLEIQRAIQQDPTVYQYDEIYDEMTQKKQEIEQTKVNPEKKPKYIQNLMKTAERRKKENERRLERQIQKEREAEGDMFKDKEEFITSSYKQKLEEFKKAEEEEKKMEYIESIMDVSKQQDLGGFYRHLYKETVSDLKTVDSKPEEKEESPKNEEKTCNTNQEDNPTEPVKQHERNYRKRHHSETPDGDENKEKDSSSSSSDSDSSSDSSSSSSSSDEEKTDTKEPEAKQIDSKSGPEDGEIVELDKKKNEKAKPVSKPSKIESKLESKDEKLKNGSRSFKQEDKDRRDRSYRSSGYDRDRNRNLSRRDDRNYRDQDRDRDRERDRDRDRDRERERERERRDDRKMRDRGERRSSDSKRRRSKTPDRRRKSRERSSERSRSRKGPERMKSTKEVKLNNNNINNNSNINNCNNNNNSSSNNTNNAVDEGKNKETKELRKEVKEADEKQENEAEEEVKINIWEKRTVGAVFEAAVERYKLRKAARGL